MNPQELTVIISVIGIVAVAVNVYVGLRLAAVQSKLEGDAAALKAELLEQFITWKDEVLNAINGKYVSEKLIVEIRTGLGREIQGITSRLDHIDERCESRLKDCPLLRAVQSRTGSRQPEYPRPGGRVHARDHHVDAGHRRWRNPHRVLTYWASVMPGPLGRLAWSRRAAYSSSVTVIVMLWRSSARRTSGVGGRALDLSAPREIQPGSPQQVLTYAGMLTCASLARAASRSNSAPLNAAVTARRLIATSLSITRRPGNPGSHVSSI